MSSKQDPDCSWKEIALPKNRHMWPAYASIKAFIKSLTTAGVAEETRQLVDLLFELNSVKVSRK